MRETKFATSRILHILFMLFTQLLLLLFWKFQQGQGIDDFISHCLLTLLFFLMLVLDFVLERLREHFHDSGAENYSEFAKLAFFTSVILAIYSFLPYYIVPFLFLSMLYSVVGNSKTTVLFLTYYSLMFCINVRHNFYELAAYLFFIIIGMILQPYYAKKSYRPYLVILILTSTIMTISLFYFLSTHTITGMIFLYALISGIVTNLLLVFIFDRMKAVSDKREELDIQKILSEEYLLVKEIRAFSGGEYKHAKKMADLCFRCAVATGLDPFVCMAGGFYYRLGILEGEPVVKNGVSLAQANCFPKRVVDILAEYKGEEMYPSTPESALVSIVDDLLCKFEHLEDETKNSSWNREIVILQALNDRSSEGLYDHSGLSINQYLKIREFFVRGKDF